MELLILKIKSWKEDFSLLDNSGISYVDKKYNKAYVRHLFISNELLGKQIASIHNLSFYNSLVEESRKHIIK